VRHPAGLPKAEPTPFQRVAKSVELCLGHGEAETRIHPKDLEDCLLPRLFVRPKAELVVVGYL
jgi:hypothetical protein